MRRPAATISSCLAAFGAMLAPALADPLVLPPPATGVVISGVQVPQPATPYGPGFNGGVVVGTYGQPRPTPACPSGGCEPVVNRPFHNHYYRHYFELPAPDYDTPARAHRRSRLADPDTR